MSQTIEQIPPDQLRPYERNSRTHSPQQVQQIAASITAFGFVNPVLIDADRRIIAGHGRVLAAASLGLPTVPCLQVAGLTEAQIRGYIIADNKLALDAGWDIEMLKAELDDLSLSWDITLLGLDALLPASNLDFGAQGDDPSADDGGSPGDHAVCPKCGCMFQVQS